MDVFPSKFRSEIMRRVRSKDTKPEMIVRKLVYGMGLRYRLHCRSLHGCPDLVLSSRRKVIFVHGCFWHRHKCPAAKLPKSNYGYWRGKQDRNAERDERNATALRRDGWKVLTIWECEIKRPQLIERRLRRFLTGD